jgi:hypothetical protein
VSRIFPGASATRCLYCVRSSKIVPLGFGAAALGAGALAPAALALALAFGALGLPEALPPVLFPPPVDFSPVFDFSAFDFSDFSFLPPVAADSELLAELLGFASDALEEGEGCALFFEELVLSTLDRLRGGGPDFVLLLGPVLGEERALVLLLLSTVPLATGPLAAAGAAAASPRLSRGVSIRAFLRAGSSLVERAGRSIVAEIVVFVILTFVLLFVLQLNTLIFLE